MKEKLAGGADPPLVMRAVRELAQEGRPVTHLPAAIDKLETSRVHRPTTPFVAPPPPTPEEIEANKRACAEAADKVRRLAGARAAT